MEMSFSVKLDTEVEKQMFKSEMNYLRADICYKTWKAVKRYDNRAIKAVMCRGLKAESHSYVIGYWTKHILEAFTLEFSEDPETHDIITSIKFSQLFFDMPLNSLPFNVPKLHGMMKKWNPERFRDIITGQVKKLYGNCNLIYFSESAEWDKARAKKS